MIYDNDVDDDDDDDDDDEGNDDHSDLGRLQSAPQSKPLVPWEPTCVFPSLQIKVMMTSLDQKKIFLDLPPSPLNTACQ